MPPVEAPEVSQQPPPPAEEHKQPKIGIIYPPPEVRNIVDKTAGFVARNGPEFESRIRQNEINNPKFNFLNANDPYHAYYQHKVKDFSEGRATESSQTKITAPSAARLVQETPKSIQDLFIPTEPPAEFEFVSDPPSINALELDVVKLTAQFVARNGRQFLTQLMTREQRNYQFDFLRPQHGLFNYFTKLVEQYTKILIPPKDLIHRLSKECADVTLVNEQVRYRVDWHKYQERMKKREEEATERERVAYAMIDWHDFVVVETVDFQPNETGNFPTPTNPEEVGARVLAEERKYKVPDAIARKMADVDLGDSGVDDDVDLDDDGEEIGDDVKQAESEGSDNEDMEQSDEEESDDEGEDGNVEDVPPPPPPPVSNANSVPPPPRSSPPPSIPPPPPPVSKAVAPPLRPNLQPPTNVDQMLIRRDYDPKAAKTSSGDEVYLVSPFTGERIPASQVPKHIRIGLLDQKWIEQRDREVREKKDEEQVFASGSLIESSLKQLAERRTDIFGIGVDETMIGKKLGEEEDTSKDEDLIWDGHSGTVGTVAKRNRESITAEQQKERNELQRQQDEEKERTNPIKLVPPPPAPPAPPSQPPPPQPPMPPPPSTTNATMFVPPLPPQRPQLIMSAPPGIQPPPRHLLMPMARPMPPPPAFLAPMAALHTPQPPPMPMLHQQQQSHHQMHPPGMMEDNSGEPPNKKQRTEESLIPEDQFLRTNRSPVSVRVLVPAPIPDKPEWKLNNQMLTFSLPLTENIATLKNMIADKLGMPVGKQKLQLDGLFLKDNNTLAYYNFSANIPVHLYPKERGGRRK